MSQELPQQATSKVVMFATDSGRSNGSTGCRLATHTSTMRRKRGRGGGRERGRERGREQEGGRGGGREQEREEAIGRERGKEQ